MVQQTTITLTLAYPGMGPDHPAGQWCVDYTDELDVQHHGHAKSADLFPALPAEVRRPLRAALQATRSELQGTADMLTTERQNYRGAVQQVTADLDAIPAEAPA